MHDLFIFYLDIFSLFSFHIFSSPSLTAEGFTSINAGLCFLKGSLMTASLLSLFEHAYNVVVVVRSISSTCDHLIIWFSLSHFLKG